MKVNKGGRVEMAGNTSLTQTWGFVLLFFFFFLEWPNSTVTSTSKEVHPYIPLSSPTPPPHLISFKPTNALH